MLRIWAPDKVAASRRARVCTSARRRPNGTLMRSLRHRAEVGLLKRSGGTDRVRVYPAADVEKILAIRRLKQRAFTLGQMRASERLE